MGTNTIKVRHWSWFQSLTGQPPTLRRTWWAFYSYRNKPSGEYVKGDSRHRDLLKDRSVILCNWLLCRWIRLSHIKNNCPWNILLEPCDRYLLLLGWVIEADLNKLVTQVVVLTAVLKIKLTSWGEDSRN